MKLLPLLASLLFISLAFSREPTTGLDRPPMDEPEYLDERFEDYWENDFQAEKAKIQRVGKVISSFVRDMAGIRARWYEEFKLLRQLNEEAIQNNRKISKKDRKRLEAYEHIFLDLPKRNGHATRDVHRKTHGCLTGSLKIAADLPEDLQKGLFEPGKEFDVIFRYSNGNPRNRKDIQADARGLAVKFLKKGTLKPGKALNSYNASDLNASTQLDFLSINHPTFFVNDPEIYAKINEYFLSKNDDVEAFLSHEISGLKSVFFGGMKDIEKLLALRCNGSIIHHPFYQTYHSMSVYRLGDYEDDSRTALKFRFVPESSDFEEQMKYQAKWTEDRSYNLPYKLLNIPRSIRKEMKKDPFYLRSRLNQSFHRDFEPGSYQVKMQVQRFISREDTPVEDTTRIWFSDEKEKSWWKDYLLDHTGILDWISRGIAFKQKELKQFVEEDMKRQPTPLIDLAQITLNPMMNADTVNTQVCEDLSFNPWNSIKKYPEHKPLGIIGRIRRAAYFGSRNARHTINRVPRGTPVGTARD